MRKIPQRGSQPRQHAPETDMAAVLDFYQVDYVHKAGWIKIKCPVHKESRPSATVNLEGGFHCNSCGARGGDGLQLLRLIEDCDFPTAVKKYAEITGVEIKTGSSEPQTAKRVKAGAGFAPKFSRPRRPNL